MEFAPIISISLIFGGSLVGFFCTKTRGFGKFTSSLLLLILVLFVTAIAFSANKLEWTNVSNLLFAIAGYAGGLVTPKEESVPDKSQGGSGKPRTEVNENP